MEGRQERRWYDPQLRDYERQLESIRDVQRRDARILGEQVALTDELGLAGLSIRQRQAFPALMLFWEQEQDTLGKMVESAQVGIVIQERRSRRNTSLVAAAAIVGSTIGPPLTELLGHAIHSISKALGGP